MNLLGKKFQNQFRVRGQEALRLRLFMNHPENNFLFSLFIVQPTGTFSGEFNQSQVTAHDIIQWDRLIGRSVSRKTFGGQQCR